MLMHAIDSEFSGCCSAAAACKTGEAEKLFHVSAAAQPLSGNCGLGKIEWSIK
jgi:hypothetical protein